VISIDTARDRVLAEVRPLPPEDVPLADALGRVAATEVRSAIDVPPFDPSAMDGFAVPPGADGELEIVGEARAGAPWATPLEAGSAVRISTGAPVPDGTGAVVPVERTEEDAGRVRVPALGDGENVRRRGEDVAAGDLLVDAGTELSPAALGVLASVGLERVACAARPRVGVIATGDELTEPGRPLGPGEIYASNAIALTGLVAQAGGEASTFAAVHDDAEATRTAIEGALVESDVVCVTGGVSVGPHDHVKGAFAAAGVEERFWRVALQPGKPTWFGVAADGTLAFGLPGNPVSALVTFQLFARPALRALQGADPASARAEARLDVAVARKRERDQAIRVRLRSAADGLHAEPTGNQGSHRLTSMLGADGLALIRAGEGEVAAGASVQVELA
jgi:molybdopterin molybdotransferase